MLDSTKFNGDDPKPIDNNNELIEVFHDLKDTGLIGLDTEFNRTDTYRPQLCLIQVAKGKQLACVDLLADFDINPFFEALEQGSGIKLFHAARQDLEALYLARGRLPDLIFDTQIGAGLLGHAPQAGYATLVEELLGVRLAKDSTRTDWSRRPLSARQLAYAIDDVRHLHELYDRLRNGLEEVGRLDWAMQDSAALLDPALHDTQPEEAWQRMGAIRFMPVSQQARARQLAEWREQRARQINRPRQWVISDKALMALAANGPATQSGLAGIDNLPPAVVRKQGTNILQIIAAADQKVQRGEIDFVQESKPAPPDAKKLKALAGVVAKAAKDLDIAPELLATRKDLAALLRGQRDIRILSGWRKDIVGDLLLGAL